ncbi:aspartate aminotransferase [Salinibacter sp. 10B]|uniref:pyridoxal phosphate-dependent aminotransferase n=1 Tax=Salinibacter sp. 10B TaxID=1923971 RepID=UPI000CF49364|nr:pyridoxal phosphate-dependent aminotransferase [Salinibacter sp. 10B]PQJ35662.1 aspartate aminotransferase [Salinibacter sp. 10B]
MSFSVSIAERARPLEQSDIRSVTQRVERAGGINLGQGICDLPTPQPIKARAQQAIADDHSIYSHYAGIEPLRRAILEKVQDENDLPASSPEEVMVGVGSTGCFVAAAFTLLEEGDEVVLFEPFYGYHRNILELTGATIRYVPLGGPASTFDRKRVEDVLTPKTKAVVVNTPANPSGKVWTREELGSLLDLMQKEDLVAITDEIYEYMLYDGAEHVSLASLPDAYERTITLSGFSKTYNVTGWRLGYGVAPDPIAEKMGLMNDLLYICAPRPLQHAALAAFDEMGDDYVAELQSDYAERRRLMCETLEDIGFDVPWPEGAYYALADFGDLAEERSGFADDEAACETLVQEAKIASVTGRSFYQNPADGKYQLRFCFAKELPVLRQACEQLRAAFG